MIVKNAIENQSMAMEIILTRDQRTTSHRVHDHVRRVINALASKSTISSFQQTKYQDNIVARPHCIRATTAKTLKREKKSDSHLMPTFYHDRRTLHSNASFSVLRSLSKSKLPLHTLTREQTYIYTYAYNITLDYTSLQVFNASNDNCDCTNERWYCKINIICCN